MRRTTPLTLMLGAVALLALLLFPAMDAHSAATAAGDTIMVPDDYATIQAAIDAATDGDEIWVASGVYTENLSITEGIALSGGWNEDFTARTPGNSLIDGFGAGRVISITCPTSDTVVTIDGFTIANGDAGGLGAPEMPEVSISNDLRYGYRTVPEVETTASASPTEQAEQLRAGLADLAAQGQYPGGEPAFQAMLDRLERVTAIAEKAKARSSASPVQQQDRSAQSTGSGGGVYSYNASLQLLDNWIIDNLANQQGTGAGGGVYVAMAPSGGVRIASNTFSQNVAASDGNGVGGGLFVSQAPGAIIGNNTFDDNVASTLGDGLGGGIYVTESTGASIQDNELTNNLGTNAGYGAVGLGGGLAVESSTDVLITNNEAGHNLASGSWYSGLGAGGGFYLHHVDGIVVRENNLYDNIATLKANGGAGGMYLAISQNAVVEDNVVTGNWGSMIQLPGSHAHGGESGAGGIGVVNVHGITVKGNEIRENTALVYGAFEASVAGGGFNGIGMFDNAQLIDNIITGNVACQSDCDVVFSFGGGVDLTDVWGVVVTDNTIDENVGSLLGGGGFGGGLHIRNAIDSQILNNRFLRNRGGTGDGGSGGGLALDYFPPAAQSVSVDANLFLGNLASSDPSVASSGGAANIVGFDQSEGGFSFTNNVLVGNQASHGGGLNLASIHGGTLANNTLYDNGEIGVLVDYNVPALTLTNNIVVSHTVGISVSEATSATVRYTLWDNNDTDIGGGGTINHAHPVYGTPAFVDPANHNYHLATASAARDAGDPAGVPPAPNQDIDSVARPQGLAVDIGAYEWQGHYQYLPQAW